MADGTKIEWTEATWNPIRARLKSDPSVIGWHCEHASPGCVNCYSETRNLSGRCNLGTRLPFKPGHRKDVEVYLDEKVLLQPLHWKKPRLIFPCSMTDLFGEFVTDEMLDRIFAVMALCPQHTFQVLTKRSARMREYCSALVRGERSIWQEARQFIPGRPTIVQLMSDLEWSGLDHRKKAPLPNLWLGVSVEDQQRAEERVPDLLATPAAVRWLSCEPLLGAVDPTRVEIMPDRFDGCGQLLRSGIRIDVLAGKYRESGMTYIGEWDINKPYPAGAPAIKVDWIVAGGESGPGARPMHPDWARSLRDQCAAAGVPFFFKQWGEWAPAKITGTSIEILGAPSLTRVGKKRAGRLLDGVEHNAMPVVSATGRAEAAHV